MTAMPKEKMIQYLSDYANIQDLMAHNPDVPIGTLFQRYMYDNRRYEDANLEYYTIMLRVYSSYTYLKIISINEDFLLNRDDYLSNNDLAGFEMGCQFINKPHNLTNKKLIQLIRDAFNHNDAEGIDRFKMSLNGKNFEVEFKDINQGKEGTTVEPLQVKFDSEFLAKLNRTLNEKRQNEMVVSFNIPDDFSFYSKDLDSELDRITIVRYYFKKKLPREIIERFNELADTEGLTNEQLIERSNQLHSFAKSISEPVEHRLNKYQINKLKSYIVDHKRHYPEILDDASYPTMHDFLVKVVPLPALKIRDFEQQELMCGYFEDTSLSLKDIYDRVVRVLNNEEKLDDYGEVDSFIHDALEKKEHSFVRTFAKNLINFEFFQLLPMITYIDAVVSHCCTDKIITINGRDYEREKIRNSFVHLRWYLNKKLKVSMYDADPRNINDYNLEFIGNIDIRAFKVWADEYMQNINQKRARG